MKFIKNYLYKLLNIIKLTESYSNRKINKYNKSEHIIYIINKIKSIMQIVCLGLLFNYTFTLCFNSTIREANYVEYIQETHGGCKPRPSFKQIPSDSYNSRDYKNITKKYDRGHLVPNADYGCSTFIMGNVVPQLKSFNQIYWKNIENMIRMRYEGMRVVKGCKYTGKIISDINIPDGCYWLVFNNSELIDNGYMNQFTLDESKELPYWYM